jgi:hypothetical protein
MEIELLLCINAERLRSHQVCPEMEFWRRQTAQLLISYLHLPASCEALQGCTIYVFADKFMTMVFAARRAYPLSQESWAL